MSTIYKINFIYLEFIAVRDPPGLLYFDTSVISRSRSCIMITYLPGLRAGDMKYSVIFLRKLGDLSLSLLVVHMCSGIVKHVVQVLCVFFV